MASRFARSMNSAAWWDATQSRSQNLPFPLTTALPSSIVFPQFGQKPAVDKLNETVGFRILHRLLPRAQNLKDSRRARPEALWESRANCGIFVKLKHINDLRQRTCRREII